MLGLGLNIWHNTRSWKLLKMLQPLRPNAYPRLNAVLFWLLPLSILVASGNTLNTSDVCYSSYVYSPFTGPTKNSMCWWWAGCVLDSASEVRKQQFAATSLIMGLVPLTLKHIVWPDYTTGLVSLPRNWFLEILVRALGHIPVVTRKHIPVVTSDDSPPPAPPGIRTRVLLTLAVLVGYGALVVMELYSKRSSLGCPYPLFICTWFIVALIPASIRKSILTSTIANSANLCMLKSERWLASLSCLHDFAWLINIEYWLLHTETIALRILRHYAPNSSRDDLSADQGSEKKWWIQLIWAVYYAAGTLVFSSIMAVTVVELAVWVILTCYTDAASRLLAFRLCSVRKKVDKDSSRDCSWEWLPLWDQRCAFKTNCLMDVMDPTCSTNSLYGVGMVLVWCLSSMDHTVWTSFYVILNTVHGSTSYG